MPDASSAQLQKLHVTVVSWNSFLFPFGVQVSKILPYFDWPVKKFLKDVKKLSQINKNNCQASDNSIGHSTVNMSNNLSGVFERQFVLLFFIIIQTNVSLGSRNVK